jgi:pimeloyl-ACP methyl ester carboxylesterase
VRSARTCKGNETYSRRKVRMPVLALGAELITGDGTLRQLKPISDNAQGGVLPRSGHWLASEQPDELVRRLLTFLWGEVIFAPLPADSKKTSLSETKGPVG